MSLDPSRPREAISRSTVPRPATAWLTSSPPSGVPEIFTVIHRGDAFDPARALELVEAVTTWAAAAEPGGSRSVDVWAAPWNRLTSGCLATVIAFGAPFCNLHLPVADDLVAKMSARGVAVRHRRARQSAIDDAELRAISQGWPIDYL